MINQNDNKYKYNTEVHAHVFTVYLNENSMVNYDLFISYFTLFSIKKSNHHHKIAEIDTQVAAKYKHGYWLWNLFGHKQMQV